MMRILYGAQHGPATPFNAQHVMQIFRKIHEFSLSLSSALCFSVSLAKVKRAQWYSQDRSEAWLAARPISLQPYSAIALRSLVDSHIPKISTWNGTFFSRWMADECLLCVCDDRGLEADEWEFLFPRVVNSSANRETAKKREMAKTKGRNFN